MTKRKLSEFNKGETEHFDSSAEEKEKPRRKHKVTETTKLQTVETDGNTSTKTLSCDINDSTLDQSIKKSKKKKHRDTQAAEESTCTTKENKTEKASSQNIDDSSEPTVKNHKKKKHKDSKAVSENATEENNTERESNNTGNVTGVSELSLEKHKKKKHKGSKSFDDDTTEENTTAKEFSYTKKPHRDINAVEENNEKELNNNNSNIAELSDRKHKKRKQKHNTAVEESAIVEKKIKKDLCNTNDGQVELSEKTTKTKHKSMMEEETTTTEKKVKFTAEYFGEKPAKAKKKKKNKVTEKKTEKTEAEGPSKKDAALEYLKLWNTDRQKWKFQKIRQVWLLQHMYQVNEVPDDSFAILLSYLDGLKGKARETTIADAEKSLQSLEDEDDSSPDIKDPLKYDRARQLLQSLS
ncbi:myb-like protein X isoform X2 [Gigantopelta aegis]|uniref:myb-like protein X isoform X2 n=1 Tax=Gigantopelta aegis TaxID=1735272 RepID=UPI001B888621|nr:myb-like protein X isoform X2 [Gigantopelta aegis]